MMIYAVRSWEKQMEWSKKIRSIARRATPEEVHSKIFMPKYSNLEILEDDAFWDKWKKKDYIDRTPTT